MTTTAPIINLTEAEHKRGYTTLVYAGIIGFFAVFAVFAGIYAFTQGDTVNGIFGLAIGALLAAFTWSLWQQEPWRFRLGLGIHIAGILYGIYQLLLWGGHLAELINASQDISAAGTTLGAILAELPRLEVNSLPLADGILLITLNVGLLYLMRAVQSEDKERQVDSNYHSDTELQLERFLGNSSARIGGVIVIVLLVITYVMPRVDPYHGLIILQDGDLSRRLDAPDCIIGWFRLQQNIDTWTADTPRPTAITQFPCEHPFGFDKNGRDMARRVLHGISVSLAVSVIAVGISLATGTLIGLTAGYIGGIVDSLLMRLMDIMLAFPALLLAIAIVAMRGPGLENGMIAIGIVGVPVYARLSRSMALSIREQEFVAASNSIGASWWHIIRKHILPNSLAPLIVQSTLGLGTAVIETAALGFLGLGQQPPYPELGKMLSESREVMTSGKWWVMLFPALTVMLIVLGFNLLGDALRDTLDPKLRGS